jgi:hypothetical protein
MFSTSLLLNDATEFSEVRSKFHEQIVSSKLAAPVQQEVLVECARLLEMFERQRTGVTASGAAFSAEKTIKGNGYRVFISARFGAAAQPSLAGRIFGWLTARG